MNPAKIDAEKLLRRCEANTRAPLYKARWDETAAAEIVPQLSAVLLIDDSELQRRALATFVTIGPEAWQAAPRIIPLLRSDYPLVFPNAALALYCVSLRKPEQAVKPLIEMARMPGREKFAMHALIGLGTGAKSATPVFVTAFDNKTVYMRRLALRGLKEICADREQLDPVLLRAEKDRSKEIREYAAKIAAFVKR